MAKPDDLRVGKNFAVVDKTAGEKPFSTGDKAKDKERVEQMAQRIAELQNVLYAERRRKLLVILQGMDTSGKDGTVRGVFGRIDPLGIRTVAFKAPTAVEKEHDYLWRVHQQVPGQGELVIFNRSHYEDVLVTRVHGWIDEKECRRRYAHIRDFERMLAETGTTILKFFLHISRDEQKDRLQARIDNPEKHWKFDTQDIEERKFWSDYQQAYEQAIRETDAGHAPWYSIPADSKTHRNLAIASIVQQAMEAMQLGYPPPKPELAKIRIE
ncbi:polyphosphate kinase 2 family protein [Noviherbaspirillum aerium]|uniref:polyphosphate kinase 2 family protein n=1 Tax=Noviherbaspirillum aerium TaxID=2588497 RepID=UPI00124CCAE3|nr:polyphosphate kinase 2 family protein [Noviherbaspirillum aerium]